MKQSVAFYLFLLILMPGNSISFVKELPKIAVWDLVAGNTTPSYAQDLTSILVSEITKLGKYEVYSQENVRTLAGWTAERMTLGCTDTKCLTALGHMDISKLISGRIGKIGNRYSVSLNLFDTQNAKAENAVSEIGHTEDELIDLVQVAVRKLLGVEASRPLAEEKSTSGPVTREQEEKMKSLAGSWRSKEGNIYKVTVEGRKIRIEGIYPKQTRSNGARIRTAREEYEVSGARDGLWKEEWHYLFDLEMKGNTLEGSNAITVRNRHVCEYPGETVPVSGAVSDDGRSIVLNFKESFFHWTRYLDNRAEANYKQTCTQVSPAGKREVTIGLVARVTP